MSIQNIKIVDKILKSQIPMLVYCLQQILDTYTVRGVQKNTEFVVFIFWGDMVMEGERQHLCFSAVWTWWSWFSTVLHHNPWVKPLNENVNLSEKAQMWGPSKKFLSKYVLHRSLQTIPMPMI